MENKSKFIKVQCPECRSEQITFGKSSTKVKCQNCKKVLIKTRGGRAKVKAKITEVLK